jgi:FkbM family methyltransferase
MPWKEPWLLKLRRRVRKPYNRLFHRDYFISKYFGAKFLLAPRGIGTLEISAGISERPELQFFIDRCRALRPSAFIDVGANIGMYSCILLKAGVISRAIAFEPDARNRAHLGANLLMNGLLEAVDVRPHAAGDAVEQFYLLPGAIDGGFSRVTETAEPGAYAIDVRPLDDVLALSGQRLAVKIDVEGFEYRVLRGMQRTLRENKCIVQVECFNPKELSSLMEEAGYKAVGDFLPNYVFEN